MVLRDLVIAGLAWSRSARIKARRALLLGALFGFPAYAQPMLANPALTQAPEVLLKEFQAREKFRIAVPNDTLLKLNTQRSAWITSGSVLKFGDPSIQKRAQPIVEDSDFFNKLPEPLKKPVGDETASLACAESQRKLAVFGLSGSKYSVKKAEEPIERQFAKACLSPVRGISKFEAVEPRIGRLYEGSQVICTITLIDDFRILTARHCFFKISKIGSNFTAAIKENAGNFQAHFGSISHPIIYGVKALWVPVNSDQSKYKHLKREDFENSIKIDADASYLDYIVAELDRKSHLQSASIEINDRPVPSGKELSLLGYYPGYNLIKVEDDSGIRYQHTGLCKMLARAWGQCLLHACATSQGASGAPIFIENESGRLALAAVHIGAVAKPDLCKTPAELNSAPNQAIEIIAGDYPWKNQ